jgi:uncharacterized protein (TIGR03067 family)
MSMSAPAAPTAKTQHRSELEQLQGSWKSVAGRREAKLLIAGNRFTFEFCTGDGGGLYMGTFVLDPEAAPKRMDMVIDEGVGEHRGQHALCIYHLESDILRWCPTKPGSRARLTSFPSVDDDKYVSLVFKHVRRHRAH